MPGAADVRGGGWWKKRRQKKFLSRWIGDRVRRHCWTIIWTVSFFAGQASQARNPFCICAGRHLSRDGTATDPGFFAGHCRSSGRDSRLAVWRRVGEIGSSGRCTTARVGMLVLRRAFGTRQLAQPLGVPWHQGPIRVFARISINGNSSVHPAVKRVGLGLPSDSRQEFRKAP